MVWYFFLLDKWVLFVLLVANGICFYYFLWWFWVVSSRPVQKKSGKCDEKTAKINKNIGKKNETKRISYTRERHFELNAFSGPSMSKERENIPFSVDTGTFSRWIQYIIHITMQRRYLEAYMPLLPPSSYTQHFAFRRHIPANRIHCIPCWFVWTKNT